MDVAVRHGVHVLTGGSESGDRERPLSPSGESVALNVAFIDDYDRLAGTTVDG